MKNCCSVMDLVEHFNNCCNISLKRQPMYTLYMEYPYASCHKLEKYLPEALVERFNCTLLHLNIRMCNQNEWKLEQQS